MSTEETTSAVPPRRGPRPLLLHLMLAASSNSRDAWQRWSSVWLSWKPGDPPPDIAAFMEGAPSWQIDRGLITAIAGYRRHPYRRAVDSVPVIWSEGSSRLLDYGGAGPAVLFVPSLVNRAYIFDLARDASFLRYLAANAVHPLLLDWGWPEQDERGFGLTDYIAGRLARAIGACSQPLILAGYCMGGLLALAAALRAQDRLRGLALLATPWDFHANDPNTGQNAKALLGLIEPMMHLTGTMPIDALQTLFAMVDPDGIRTKYRKFGMLDPATAQAERFVALEDWLNDGVPLAAPVARDVLGRWYGDNTPHTGRWMVEGIRVDPAALRIPSLVVIPSRDRLVSPASAAALLPALPHATVLRPPAGHIGMIAGETAPHSVWQPFANWASGL